MPKQEFNKEAIWKNISNDERLPQPKSKRKYVYIYLCILLLIVGVPLAKWVIPNKQTGEQHVIGNSTTKSAAHEGAIEFQTEQIVNSNSSIQSTESSHHIPETQNKNKEKSKIKLAKVVYSNRQTLTSVLSDENIEKTSQHKDESLNQLEKTIFNSLSTDPFSNEMKDSKNGDSMQDLSFNEVNPFSIDKLTLNKSPGNLETTIESYVLKRNDIQYLPYQPLESLMNLYSKIDRGTEEESTSKPYSVDIRLGIGRPSYSITTSSGSPQYHLESSDLKHSGHVQVSLGYLFKNWDFQAGFNVDYYKSIIESQQVDIGYEVNGVTSRIEKIQTTTNYRAYQYYSSEMIHIGVGRRISVGPLYVTPIVNLRYAFFNSSQGSLLDEEFSFVPLEDNIKIANPLSIEGGVKFCFKSSKSLSPYLFFGHSRNGSYKVDQNDVIRFTSTSIQAGVNYRF